MAMLSGYVFQCLLSENVDLSQLTFWQLEKHEHSQTFHLVAELPTLTAHWLSCAPCVLVRAVLVSALLWCL